MLRSFAITGLSFMLTSLVLGNAYYQKKQFYPSVVYITKSNPSMAVIYLQALVFVVLTGKMLRKVFFGQLRAAEMEHLIERSWYALTETCLAFTVFRDDFSPRFVALFTLLLFLKCFHWLAEDRIDYMERSPAISWLFHLRVVSLMLLLGLLDALFVKQAFHSIIHKGPSVQLVFGFEYEILFTVVVMMFIKYVAHGIDLQSENPWDNKALYLLYAELIMGFVRVVLYILFVVIMIKVHTFPLFAIRPMYLTLRAFQKAAQDVVLSRRAIRHMNTLYPDATPEELSSGDNSCIICREEMTTGCKKLPCNHIFHTSCLRSWFQRQQTCPTCRLEVLRAPRPSSQQQQQQAQQQAQQQGQPQQAANQPPGPINPFNNMQGMFGGFGFQWPPNGPPPGVHPPFGWPPQQQQQHPPASQQPTPSTTTATSSPSPSTSVANPGIQPEATPSQTTSPTAASTTSAPSSTAIPSPAASMPGLGMPFYGMPPMMPPMFGAFGFPPPPQPMEGLSDEELRAMEGVERSNVEARIYWLRDIQALLDGAMLLIGQYNMVASQLGSQGINTAPAPATPQTYSAPQAPSSAPQSSTTSTESSYQLPQPTWWPESQGARPKYTSTMSKTHTSSVDPNHRPRSTSISLPDEKKEKEETEGATGYTPPKEEMIPKWENSHEEEQGESMHEIRKRRLQRFEQQQQMKAANSEDDEKSKSELS